MKKTIKEESDKRIDNAFRTLISAKKALEDGQTQLQMNLGYHFLKLYETQLTEIDEHIESSVKSLNELAKTIRMQLKQ